jgi:TRAP-type C4-dicarboxylate transport system permease large subunit
MARDVPLEKVFRGSMPFLAVLVIAAAILTAFPQIATFLPGLIK